MNFLLLGVDTFLSTMLNSYNELIVQDVQYVSVVGGGGGGGGGIVEQSLWPSFLGHQLCVNHLSDMAHFQPALYN
jgi:hypothetical protein